MQWLRMFFGKFVTEWKKLKRQIRHKVSIGCKEGVPREKKNPGGGVRCDLIHPYYIHLIHQHEREAESQGEAFCALFRD